MFEQEAPAGLILSAPMTLDTYADPELNAGTTRVAGEGPEVEGDNLLLAGELEEAADRYRQILNANRRVREKLAHVMQALNDKGSIHVLGSDLMESTVIGRVIQLRAIVDYSKTINFFSESPAIFDRADLVKALVMNMEGLPTLQGWDRIVLAGAFHVALDRRRETIDGSKTAEVTCQSILQIFQALAPGWVDTLRLCELLSDYRKYNDEAETAKVATALAKLNIERAPILAPAFKAAVRVGDNAAAVRTLKELCRRYQDNEKLQATVACAAIEMDDLTLLDVLPDDLKQSARLLPQIMLLQAIKDGDGEIAGSALQGLGEHFNLNLSPIEEGHVSQFDFRYGPDSWPNPRHFVDARVGELLRLLPAGEMRIRLYRSAMHMVKDDPSMHSFLLEAFLHEPATELLYDLWESTVLDQVPVALIAKLMCEEVLSDDPIKLFEDEQHAIVLGLNLDDAIQTELGSFAPDAQLQAHKVLRQWGLLGGGNMGSAPLLTSKFTFEFQRDIEGESLPDDIRRHLAGLDAAMSSLAPADLINLQAYLGRLTTSRADTISLASGTLSMTDAINQVLALNNHSLNDVGNDRVKTLTKRYGAPALLQALSELVRKPDTSADGGILDQLSKLMTAKQGTLAPRRAYLAAILNKRLPKMKGAWLDQQVAACLKRGVDIEQMIELAKGISSWNEWEQELEALRPY